MNLVGIALGHAASGSISGGDRHALEMWSHWKTRADCKLEMLTSDFGAATLRRFGYDIPTRLVARPSKPIGAYRLEYALRCVSAVVATFAMERPAVVHASSAYFYDVLPALALLCRSYPRATLIASMFHLIPPPNVRDGNAVVNAIAYVEQRLMLKLLRRFAAHIVVDNDELRERLVRIGFDRNRVVLSRMGVRTRMLAKQSDNGEAAGAVYVGRFSAAKGVDSLLRAWRLVVDQRPDARLRLIGRDEGGFSAHRVRDELGLEQSVSIEEGASDQDVAVALSSSRIFVTASREEGYGLSLLEAFACGTPAVTFDLAAFADAFPTGRIVARDASDSGLADTILRALGDDAIVDRERRAVEALDIPTWLDVAGDVWQSVCER